MSRSEVQKEEKELSLEMIIDKIRLTRNDRIKEMLNDQNLITRFKDSYNAMPSDIKREFIKRDLKALLIAPVDLVHYAGVINNIRETKALDFNESDNLIFDKELDSIFSKYQY